VPLIHDLSIEERKKVLRRTQRAFVVWCKQEFDVDLYDYQLEIAYWVFFALLVEPIDIALALSRQSGKTEIVTLLVRFLIIFFRLLTGDPLMCGFASPKGEQAKTSLDRIKKSVGQMRDRWQVEDREFNAATVRAYRHDVLHAEIFRFSLAPTTSNESKTLNLLIVDEAHLADDAKRSNELDPMLSSTSGITIHIGVGAVRQCDFKKIKDGLVPGTKAIVVPVDKVIADRRKKFEQTGDVRHLAYEKAFERELRKKGKANPEIRRNYLLHDTVEEGNFISRERFLTCGRREWQRKGGLLIPVEDLTFSIDWARTSDYTWCGLTTRQNDLLWMGKYPHVRYEEQMAMFMTDLKMERTCLKRLPDGSEVEEAFTYFDRIGSVRGDSTGIGDFPTEYLRDHSGLPMGDESQVKFTPQSKNEMYTLFEAALFREEGEPDRFSYWAEDPLAAELEEQMSILLREYKTDAELLSPHAPEEAGAHDDACTMCALGCLGAATGKIGELLFA
jgi:hypothetical protein